MPQHLTISRYGLAILIGILVTAVIFIIMYMIVATGERAITEKVAIYKLETDLMKERGARLALSRLPPRPVEAETRPDPISMPRIKTAKPPRIGGTDMSSVEGGLPTSTPVTDGLGAAVEGDYLPIVRVRPKYPWRAVEQGIDGFVIVELTVTPSGATESAKVIASEPGTMFDQAALAAARQFRYKPKVLNGVPVPVSGVRYKFTFEISKPGSGKSGRGN